MKKSALRQVSSRLQPTVLHLDFLTEQQKLVFRTAFELDQRWVRGTRVQDRVGPEAAVEARTATVDAGSAVPQHEHGDLLCAPAQ
jgi:hypothetical protein